MNSSLLLLPLLISLIHASQGPIRGTKCAPNQVINRVTVYDDGALEAECGPLPCGISGIKCTDATVACKGDNDVFSGMSWAPNGQSVLLRCCSLIVPKKIYVGTDLVTSGSYYVGGAIPEKDKYGKGGEEYDFVTNIRTEQGGVRVWVYRVMCPKEGQHSAPSTFAPVPVPSTPAQPQNALSRQEAFEARRKYLLERLSGRQQQQEEREEEEYEEEEEDENGASFNPLRYRPHAQAKN